MEELNSVYDYAKEHMEKSLEVLKKDFSTIRTGRVSTHIVDNIKVDYYGTPTPLNQVGSVIATDAQTITISPWDVNPNNDGETIKLFFPPMTVEQRQESAKQTKGMGEKAKIAIRNIRRDANDKVKKLAKDKIITEDEEKRGLDQVQKITDDYIKKVDELVKAKEAEVLKV